MTSADDYAWTFPIYLLATDYSMDAATETVIFDEKIRFVTPESYPGGPRAIALFTDRHLAEEFRDQMTSGTKVDLLPFVSPAALKSFLVRAQEDYLAVVVDVNRKTRRTQPFAILELIPVLERLSQSN